MVAIHYGNKYGCPKGFPLCDFFYFFHSLVINLVDVMKDRIVDEVSFGFGLTCVTVVLRRCAIFYEWLISYKNLRFYQM